MTQAANRNINKVSSLIAPVIVAAMLTGLVSCGGGGGGGGTTSFMVNTDAGTNGSISPASTTVNINNTAQLSITPDAGYNIANVSGCSGTLAGNTYTTGVISSDCTVTASFSIISYAVSASAGANGSINPASASVNHNNTASFTVTPDANYAIDTVSGCGGTLVGATYTTAAITDDCTVSANFVSSYTVSTSAGANGSISPTSVIAAENDTENFTVTADANYVIDTVSGCAGTLVGDTYTTGALTADCTVTASFSTQLDAVSALFSNAANWNDYVSGNHYSTASNIACDSSADNNCLHGGEYRVVVAKGRSSCTNLTATDDLGAFTWVCDDSTGTARLITTGLAEGYALSDLLDFNTQNFKANAVTVYDNAVLWSTTPSTSWWTNSIVVNNTGGSLTTASTVYLVTSDPGASYILAADKLALVVQPGVTLSGPGTSSDVISSVGYHDYLWLEGRIDATGDERGVFFDVVKFSVLHQFEAHNASHTGIFLAYVSRNTLSSVTVTGNTYYGIYLDFNDVYNTLSDLTIANNGGIGLYIGSTCNNNTLSDITSINNGNMGVYVSASNNKIQNVTTTNNAGYGFRFYNSWHNTLSRLTTANNGNDGVNIADGNSNTLSSVVMTNNNKGLYFAPSTTNTSNNTLSDIAMISNNSNGADVRDASNNTFTGLFMVGNNLSDDCNVNTGGINPGLVDVTCAVNGSSDHTLVTGVSLANSFVGKITSNDVQNSNDSSGSASFPASPTAFDWTRFDNRYRGWGNDGSAFPNTDNRKRWTTGTGQIWDWSLSTSDTGSGGSPALLNVLAVPTGNNTLTHIWLGTPVSSDNAGCNIMVSGSLWNGSACETSFLRRAVEIQNDDLGNDNTLCESGETCLYTPNIGSYQGHGELISAGAFTAGTLTGITLMKYASNGR